MQRQEKSEMVLSAGKTLKEQGFRVFVHYKDWIKEKSGEEAADWLIVTLDGNTTASVFVDMHHYTASSIHHVHSDAGCGLQVLDWGAGVYDPDDLAPYVRRALAYPHPPVPKWIKLTKPIVPMRMEEVQADYASRNWSLVEL